MRLFSLKLKRRLGTSQVLDSFVGSQLIEIGWFGKWAEFRHMFLICACKGHVPNSVHHITDAVIIHIELPNLCSE